MGRPRKRPVVEIEEPAKIDEPVIVPANDSSMDIDTSFLDPDVSQFSFLDMLGPEFMSAPQPSIQSQKVDPSAAAGHKGIWHFDLGDIDFNPSPPGAAPEAPPLTQEELNVLPMPDIDLGFWEKTPSLSSQGGTPPDSNYTPSFVPATGSCGCLASLYLALDSLQRLPKQVGPAMSVARNAAKAAHDAIRCPVCSPPFVNQADLVPLSSFQNMMVLGALLPSTANAYRHILVMIDEEAARAAAEGRELRFMINEYGGVWGSLAQSENVCGTTERFQNAAMEPTMWRLTVRALLKVDVYGINSSCGDGPKATCLPFTQLGLKDIVMMMEERSIRRHGQLDELIAKGFIKPHTNCGQPLPAPGERPTCLRIIDIAKSSIANLIIA